jgi:hypothetical protein
MANGRSFPWNARGHAMRPCYDLNRSIWPLNRKSQTSVSGHAAFWGLYLWKERRENGNLEFCEIVVRLAPTAGATRRWFACFSSRVASSSTEGDK